MLLAGEPPRVFLEEVNRAPVPLQVHEKAIAATAYEEVPLRGSYQREELFREEVPVVIPQTPVRRHDVQPPVVTAAVIRSDLVPVEKSFVDHGITPTMLEMDELHLCEA